MTDIQSTIEHLVPDGVVTRGDLIRVLEALLPATITRLSCSQGTRGCIVVGWHETANCNGGFPLPGTESPPQAFPRAPRDEAVLAADRFMDRYAGYVSSAVNKDTMRSFLVESLLDAARWPQSAPAPERPTVRNAFCDRCRAVVRVKDNDVTFEKWIAAVERLARDAEQAKAAVLRAGRDPKWAALYAWCEDHKDVVVKSLSDTTGRLEMERDEALAKLAAMTAERDAAWTARDATVRAIGEAENAEALRVRRKAPVAALEFTDAEIDECVLAAGNVEGTDPGESITPLDRRVTRSVLDGNEVHWSSDVRAAARAKAAEIRARKSPAPAAVAGGEVEEALTLLADLSDEYCGEAKVKLRATVERLARSEAMAWEDCATFEKAERESRAKLAAMTAERDRLRDELSDEQSCSTCGGDAHSHPSGIRCVCTEDGDERPGTRAGEVQGLRLSCIKAEQKLDAALAEVSRLREQVERTEEVYRHAEQERLATIARFIAEAERVKGYLVRAEAAEKDRDRLRAATGEAAPWLQLTPDERHFLSLKIDDLARSNADCTHYQATSEARLAMSKRRDELTDIATSIRALIASPPAKPPGEAL